jgi:hypothetical protein
MSRLIHRLDIDHMKDLIRKPVSDNQHILRRVADIHDSLPEARMYYHEKLQQSNSFTSSYILTFIVSDTYIDGSEIVLYPEFAVIPPIPKEAL